MLRKIKEVWRSVQVRYYTWRYGRPQLWTPTLTEKIFRYSKKTELEKARLEKIEEARQEVLFLCNLFDIEDPTTTYPHLFLVACRDTAIPDQEMEDDIIRIIYSEGRRRELFDLMRRAGDVLNADWERFNEDTEKREVLAKWLSQNTP